MSKIFKDIAIKTLNDAFNNDVEYLALVSHDLMLLSLTTEEYDEVKEYLEYLRIKTLSEFSHVDANLRKSVIRGE